MRRLLCHSIAAIIAIGSSLTGLWAVAPFARAADRAAMAAALESIRATDLKRQVELLADDSFEGREAGSRGGHAAGIYLARQFEQCKLKPDGNTGYFQAFNGN